MIKVLFQGIYSILVLPFLPLVARSERLFSKITSPLLVGPMKSTSCVKQLEHLIYELERGQDTPEQFIEKVSEVMKVAIAKGELDRWLDSFDETTQNVDITLARKLFYKPLKWWYLKLHFMTEGNRHGLHAHRNVLSTQVIARGRLKVQEFDRLSPLAPPHVDLRLRYAGDVSINDALMSTDILANVHGFEPYPEGAVRFQFYLRGHARFLQRFPKRGRLYVHIPKVLKSDDIIRAELGRSGRKGES